MKAALVTPFLCHLPLHPSSYLGYGAAALSRQFDLDVIDLNAALYFENKTALAAVLADAEAAPIAVDNALLQPFYQSLREGLEAHLAGYDWRRYALVFITSPSWFVTVATEEVVRLVTLIRKSAPATQFRFYGNSLGTWTDAGTLENHGVGIAHLNDLAGSTAVNRPVDFDRLPVPRYGDRNRYLFDLLPFHLKHGCAWAKCRFCSLSRGWNGGLLERSPRTAAREVAAMLHRYKPKMLVCRDNSINGRNLIGFCRYLAVQGVPWAAMARASLSAQAVDALAGSGCRLVYYGVESGSDRVLRTINKGITAARMSTFTKQVFDSGIMPAPSFVVGLPGEAQHDFDLTAEFIHRHRKYFNVINLYPAMATPASDMPQDPELPGPEALLRLFGLAAVCQELKIKVCVGEQLEEYLLCKKIIADGV